MRPLNHIKPCFLAGLFVAHAATANAQQSEWVVFADGEALGYSQNLPIADAVDGLRTERFSASGDAAFTHNFAAVGARRGPWEVAAIGRYDYGVDYSTDLAEFVNATRNDGPLADGDKAIILKINHSRGYGGQVGYRLGIGESLSITPRVQAFRADRMIDGGLRGGGVALDGDIASGRVDIDYVYTDDLLLGRDLPDRRGIGAAISLHAVYRASERLRADLDVSDLWGRIWWDEIDRTVADADTSTFTRDSDGLILVRPLLRGRNSVESHTQSLRTRWRLGLEADLSEEWRMTQTTRKIGSTWLSEFGVDYVDRRFRIGPRVELDSGAFGFALESPTLQLKLLSDSWDANTANYAEVRIGLRLGL